MAGTICTSAGEYIEALQGMLGNVDASKIDAYGDMLFEAWKDDRAVYVFGNGGSASCASHHVADYVKTAEVMDQRRLRAFSLVDNTEMLTALGNDCSYDDIFVHPLQTYAKAGDVAVGISCSGNSPNLIKELEWAKDNGMTTVAITGFSGGKAGGMVDLHMNIASDNYGVVEDIQLAVGHIVAQILKTRVSALGGE